MKRIVFIITLILAATFVQAQVNEVTLMVNGEGTTKNEATALALRSAIEQAFGTFVSANTEILNDEIIKDEIATVASGNIKSYKEISSVKTDDGYNVTVEAVVSVGKLIEYSKSHGSSAEFAGKTFAMQMKLEKLNIENEKKALHNMIRQLYLLLPEVFDYSIIVDEPKMISTEECLTKVIIAINANDNTKRFYDIIKEHLQGLCIDENLNVPEKYQVHFDGKQYCLRTIDWLHNLNFMFNYGLKQQIYAFKIENQDGKVIGATKMVKSKEDNRGFIYSNYTSNLYPEFEFEKYFDRKEYELELPKPQHKRYHPYKNEPSITQDYTNNICIYYLWPFNSPFEYKTLYQFLTQLKMPHSEIMELERLIIKPLKYENVEQPVIWGEGVTMNRLNLVTNKSFATNFWRQSGKQLNEYKKKNGFEEKYFDAKFSLRIEADGTINLLKGSKVVVKSHYKNNAYGDYFENGDLHLCGGKIITKATLDEYRNLFNTCFMEFISQNNLMIPFEVDGKPCKSYVSDWNIDF